MNTTTGVLDVDTASAVAPRWRAAITARPLLLLVCAAIALRLVLFLGRGGYVAFDEGWYLLLGRSVFSGGGYTLSGLQHTTLSPLFPLLAGAVWRVIGDPVWAGRLVAAFAAGALVWPCWHIFRRIGSERSAWLGCVIVAVMPALAPFVAPYWIGWDLWVGAEPVLHFFLFAALALVLRARERARALDWILAGAAFALAFLSRPEAVIPFGIIGLIIGIDALRRRSRSLLLHAAVFGLAFLLTAAPYWVYLHDVLGRWALTGRGVELAAPVQPAGTGGAPAGAAATIETMLWGDDETPYVQVLYALDASRTRLASTYWGVPADASPAAVPQAAPLPVADTQLQRTQPPVADTQLQGTQPPGAETQLQRPSRLVLYADALLRIAPWYVWLLAVLGVLVGARVLRVELLVVVPLVVTSLVIARVVAIDPRTQLFILPLVAFYAARGIHAAAAYIEARAADGQVRPGFAAQALAAIVVALLLGTQARWLYLSLSLGSPHHIAGTANQRIGAALQEFVPTAAPVMSWHPAIALYAEREWRVLPSAPFNDIVRYADANGIEYAVVSVYYPGPQLIADMPTEHLVLQIPDGAGATNRWNVEIGPQQETHIFARLRSVP